MGFIGSLLTGKQRHDNPQLGDSLAARIAAAAPSSGYSVKCPLPGTVLSVKVAAGDAIAAGQTLVVLEAMKMENNIDADRGGVVKQSSCSRALR